MIGKSIAIRPQIYQPLKGDVNDYSVNVYSVTNNNVTTTTGIFGESNGAYEWNANSDYLEINSSAKTYLEGSALENVSIMVDFAITDNSINTPIGYGIAGTSTADRICLSQYRGADATKTVRSFIYPTTGALIFNYTATLSNDVWHNVYYVHKNGGSKTYFDGSLGSSNATAYTNSKTSTQPLRVGSTQLQNCGRLKQTNLRLYNTELSAGQYKILYNEKGRIRA